MRPARASTLSARASLARRSLICTAGVIVALAAAVALAPASTAAAAPGRGNHQGRGLGPGCAPNRPAVAYYAGGAAAHIRGHNRTKLIPCLTDTGLRTSEVGIVVSNAGSVLLTPGLSASSTGMPFGIARSVDRGASWKLASVPPTPPWVDAFDGNLGIDRRTGRIFQITPGYIGEFAETPRVNFSDNDGRTWTAGGEPALVGPNGNADNTKIFAGPPPRRLKDLQRGYPNVVYNCAGHQPLRCQASHDGGKTWGPPSNLPFPPQPPSVTGTCSNFGLNAVVGRDGTVYMGYAPCNVPYVAISRNEGATWQAVRVADVESIGWGMTAVGMDKQGNLYAAWIAAADRLPYLSISRDGGLRWSTPLMIGAPGVKEAALPRLVSGARGQVAVAYFGSTNSPGAPFPPPCADSVATDCPAWANVTWNTYITETFNALAKQPLFWSAPLNNPAQPTWYGCSASSIGVITTTGFNTTFFGGCSPTTALEGEALGGREDYFGMDMATNDTPWVGFGQACPHGLPVAGNPHCPSTLTGQNIDATWAMAGSLVRVPT